MCVFIYICIAKRGSKGRSRTDACFPPPYNSLLSLQNVKTKGICKGASKKFPDPCRAAPTPFLDPPLGRFTV